MFRLFECLKFDEIERYRQDLLDVSRCAAPIRAREIATRTADAAAITGVRLKSISSNIFRPIDFPPVSEMKKATVASSKEARKAKMAADAMPGAILGSTILKKTCNRFAPQLSPASSSIGSSRCSDAVTVMTTYGMYGR